MENNNLNDDEDDSDDSNILYPRWYWTAGEVQKLKDLKTKGVSDSDIGKVIGRSTTAVEMKWHTLILIEFGSIR